MKCLKFALFSLLVIVFASCQKDVDGSIDGPEESKKYLSKVVEIDPAYPAEAWAMEFKYDAQNRCTSLVEKYIDSSGGGPPVIEEYTYTFHYNGSETRPFKITSDLFGSGIEWFTKFDAQGKKLQDSLVEASGGYTEVVNYSYSGNRIVARYLVDVFGSSMEFIDTVHHDGNNVTKQINAEYSMGSLGSWSEYSYTYDNHPNPFSHVNINTTFFASSSFMGLGTYIGLNKNNYLSDTYRDLLQPGTPPTTVQYQYTYDGDGYPVTVKYNDGGFSGTIKYEYR